MEVASLEKVGFHLVKHAPVEVGIVNLNVNDHPTSKHDNKIVHCVPLGKDHDNMWLFRKTLTTTILQVKDVPNPRYVRVYSTKSNGGMMTMVYEMIIEVIPNWTYLDFVFMLTTFKNRRQFIPCKHFYFTYRSRMFCDHKANDLIAYQWDQKLL